MLAAPAVSCANCASRMRTRAYRFSGNTPAFPARWFYGLCRALPGDEFVLASVIGGLMFRRTRLGRSKLRRLDTSNGCQDHTVLSYAHAPFVCAMSSLTGKPALRFHFTPDAAASTASHPAFVTIMIRPLCGEDIAVVNLIWGQREAEYFCRKGWTGISAARPPGKTD